eukprot:768419-Hanusia_phi.AAC.2
MLLLWQMTPVSCYIRKPTWRNFEDREKDREKGIGRREKGMGRGWGVGRERETGSSVGRQESEDLLRNKQEKLDMNEDLPSLPEATTLETTQETTRDEN